MNFVKRAFVLLWVALAISIPFEVWTCVKSIKPAHVETYTHQGIEAPMLPYGVVNAFKNNRMTSSEKERLIYDLKAGLVDPQPGARIDVDVPLVYTLAPLLGAVLCAVLLAAFQYLIIGTPFPWRLRHS